MDFLDSLDLHTTAADKKSNRMRSWYLYEQYKSLEKSQLDAAQRLKNRSYQERILHREINERRERRKLSEEFCHHENDCPIEPSPKSDTRPPFIESADSLFESVFDQDEIASEKRPEDTISHRSETSKSNEDFNSLNDQNNDNSCSVSINSVVINNEANKNVANDIKAELEIVKRNITEIINLQLEAEKECLEKYTELRDCVADDKNEYLRYNESCDSNLKATRDKYAPDYENGLLAVWSKLVVFSYKLMQTNRGNCYGDLTSQFLITVLAFDVLRRGINRMCRILQPYVSPIKFADDEDWTPTCDFKIILTQEPTKSMKSTQNTCHPLSVLKPKMKPRSCERKYRSEEKWQCSCKYTVENRINDLRHRGVSEPCRSVAPLSANRNSSEKILATYQKDPYLTNFKCPHVRRAVAPIIKLSQYIDMILHEIEE